MTFLDRIRSRTAQKAEPRPPARLRAGGSGERFNLPDLSEADKQANLYANLYWLQIAVGKVAEAVATTPFQVSKRTREGLQAIEDHPFEMRLAEPNEDQDQFELLEATVSWRMITGNCYWWLNRAGPEYEPAEIRIIPTYRIQPVPDGYMSIKGYLYEDGAGPPIPLEKWEVCHFKTFNPLNPYVGLSAVQALAMDAQADIASQRYNANFYARDNAKAAGILAFSDFIEDGRWNRIAEDWKEQHGGTKQNRVMRLRGVGSGGVEWISTQLSQVEIQYLEQRRFTMEAIFARFAPGLASVLAINATEANSVAGNDTFLTKAVYPMTYAIGSKVTHAVLPTYGEGLVGAFEDVRRADTQLELKEQEAYERSHTVEEVRKKYYQDKPLGDDRDGLSTQAFIQDKGQQSEPVAPPMPLLTPDQAMVQAGKALDRRRWRDKVLKAMAAGRGSDVPFDPEYLADDEAMVIRAALKRAQTADAVWKAMEG